MKVNFSIDFILGTCGESKKKRTSPPSCNSTSNSKVNEAAAPLRRTFTVEWKPTGHQQTSPSRQCPRVAEHQRYELGFDRVTVEGPNLPNSNSLKVSHGARIETSSKNPSKHLPYLHQSATVPPRDNIFSNAISTLAGSHQLHQIPRLTAQGDARNSCIDGPTSETCTKRRGSRVGRRLFTGFQILELEKAFSVKSYLTRSERVSLAENVNLTEGQIKTWFQNRRTKAKRRGPSYEDSCKNSDDGDFPAEQLSKPIRIPAHGIQVRPTFGPPDRYLRAAVADFLRRRSLNEIAVS